MKWNYCCPSCRSLLNPDRSVILLAACGGTRVLAGFHPEPGNYEFYMPPHVEVVPGSKWDFRCPCCRADLATADDENLCALDVSGNGTERRLVFSRIAGEHATFVVQDEEVSESHGEDAENYDQMLLQTKYIRV